MRIKTLIAGLLLSLSFAGSVSAAPKTATISVSPSGGSQTIDAPFSVNLILNTGGQAVSAVEVHATYSSNLEYVSADANGSVFASEISPVSASNNNLSLSRTRFDTGYNGTSGQIIALTFKPKSSGTGTITINASTSQAIAYSDVSNILNQVTNGSYSLAATVGGAAASPTATPSTAAAADSGTGSSSPSSSPASAGSEVTRSSPPASAAATSKKVTSDTQATKQPTGSTAAPTASSDSPAPSVTPSPVKALTTVVGSNPTSKNSPSKLVAGIKTSTIIAIVGILIGCALIIGLAMWFIKKQAAAQQLANQTVTQEAAVLPVAPVAIEPAPAPPDLADDAPLTQVVPPNPPTIKAGP